jgi:DNA-binding SARP family transcriptional activator
MSGGGTMEFRILGTLEVEAAGRRVEIGAPKLRALLAMLLLDANRVVSSDRLIDGLWEEQPPATGERVLQVYVSQLRKLLGPGRLERVEPGYVLRVRPGELDSERFERLRGEGELDAALALWRGRPLAEFGYARFAHGAIEQLEEVRLTCLEERIDRDLADGRHAALVSELERVAAEHPGRERFRAQLMLALYRSGRHPEALDVYQQARRELVESLGIEPGRTLRELERAILQQDPALDLVDPSADTEARAGVELSRGVFVGREAEVAALRDGLDDAFAGRGRLYLIAGEPGIGKSRLAEELAADARGRGALVLVGRCWEAGGAPVFWPWVQALRSYIDAAEPDTLRAQLGSGGSDLAQLFPELEPLVGRPAAPEAFASEGARFRLFDSLTTFLRNAAATVPLVLVLDDLHAADEPSLLLLRFVARELGSSRLLVVAAYRDVDPTLGDSLLATLAELVREPVTRTLGLGGLDEPAVASFLELTTARAAVPGLAAAVHADTDGNPLYVGEVVRLLAAEGRLDPAAVDAVAVPESVSGVIGRRLDRLSAGCRDLLVLASVLGREFELDVLVHMSGLEPDAVLELLDEATAERVLTDLPDAVARLRFAHALIRDTIYEGLPRSRRVRLHGRAGEAIEALRAGGLDEQLAELAHHFSEAAPGGGAAPAVHYARRAGERAVRLLAFEEAIRLFRMALALSPTADEQRCELLLSVGDAQARAGDGPGSKQTFQQAAELADRLGLPEQLARAAVGYGGRIVWEVSRDADYLVSVLERALAALPEEDSALRVRLLARLGGGPLRDARYPAERGLALSRDALEMARRLADPETLSYALSAYIAVRHSPDFTPEQLPLAREQLAAAIESCDAERAIEAHEHCLVTHVELGRLPEATVHLEAMATVAAQLRQPSQAWIVTVYRALVTLLEGDLERAEQLVFEARALGERAQSWNAAVSFGLQLYVLRAEQGRLAELEQLVAEAAASYDRYPVWRCVETHLAARLGRPDAFRLFDSLTANGFAALRFDEEWLVGMSLLAEAACALDLRIAASWLYERLSGYGDRIAVSYPEVSTGAVARYLGLLAAAIGRTAEAVGHFEHALELHSRIGARSWLARTRHDLAAVLLAVDGEHERAAGLLRMALQTYDELGMTAHAADAQALARDADVAA